MKKPKLLPMKVFLQTFKYAPRLAVGLIITNSKHEVLLTRRAIPPKKDTWHIPGGFVLKDETLHDCIRRVAKKELGLSVKPSSIKFLGLFENLKKDPRGHVIDAMYEIKIKTDPRMTKETRISQFFKKLPAQISFNHDQVLRKLGH